MTDLNFGENSQTPFYMAYITEAVRRFFHPAAIDDMLSTFIPMINGTDLTVSPQSIIYKNTIIYVMISTILSSVC